MTTVEADKERAAASRLDGAAKINPRTINGWIDSSLRLRGRWYRTVVFYLDLPKESRDLNSLEQGSENPRIDPLSRRPVNITARAATVGWMVPRGLTLGRTTTREPEQLRFYDSPPPRMDASVCCLPAGAAATTGVTQHPHPASLPGLSSAVGVQPPTIQPSYAAQYAADQIVPDRAQPDGPLATVLGCNGQDSWQQISSTASTGITGAVTATTTAYIDYSWLQMQVSNLATVKLEEFTLFLYVGVVLSTLICE